MNLIYHLNLSNNFKKYKRPDRDSNSGPGLSVKLITTGPDDRPLHYRGIDEIGILGFIKFFIELFLECIEKIE